MCRLLSINLFDRPVFSNTYLIMKILLKLYQKYFYFSIPLFMKVLHNSTFSGRVNTLNGIKVSWNLQLMNPNECTIINDTMFCCLVSLIRYVLKFLNKINMAAIFNLVFTVLVFLENNVQWIFIICLYEMI